MFVGILTSMKHLFLINDHSSQFQRKQILSVNDNYYSLTKHILQWSLGCQDTGLESSPRLGSAHGSRLLFYRARYFITLQHETGVTGLGWSVWVKYQQTQKTFYVLIITRYLVTRFLHACRSYVTAEIMTHLTSRFFSRAGYFVTVEHKSSGEAWAGHSQVGPRPNSPPEARERERERTLASQARTGDSENKCKMISCTVILHCLQILCLQNHDQHYNNKQDLILQIIK